MNTSLDDFVSALQQADIEYALRRRSGSVTSSSSDDDGDGEKRRSRHERGRTPPRADLCENATTTSTVVENVPLSASGSEPAVPLPSTADKPKSDAPVVDTPFSRILKQTPVHVTLTYDELMAQVDERE